MKAFYFILVSFLFFSGCQTRSGDPSALRPPTTKLFLKEINLSDSNSLSGRVRLYWSGESSNGYIKNYDIASDTAACNSSQVYQEGLIWSTTSRTDSAFLFKVPSGEQYATISFYARATDNNGLKDKNPPCLEVPVKNSPPNINLTKQYSGNALTDTIHSVLTLSWEVSDPDGSDNLDSIFIQLNKAGKWLALPRNTRSITLIPLNPEAPDSSTSKVLIGNSGILFANGASALVFQMEKVNQIFIRVKDISNSFSIADTTNKFYFKQKKSDFLYIDSYKVSDLERTVYSPILKNLYPSGYDVYDINRNSDAYLPLNWNLTFTEYLKLYKKIFWASDVSSFGGYTAMELGVVAIQNYLNFGGKGLFSLSKLPSDLGSPIYQFSPFDSISTKQGQARLSGGSKLNTNQIYSSSLDTLVSVGLVTAATPGYVKTGSQSLFTSNYQKLNGWTGPDIVAAASNGSNNKLNQVFFNTDLHNLNGRPEALKKLFNQILNTEFEP